MIVFQLILKHRTVVYVTETSSKMASTISQKWLTMFCQKAQNFLPYNFVLISPACRPNAYQIIYGETFDFQCVSVSNGNIKCSIGKSFFTANLPLELFGAAVANADTASLKFLHTLFDTYLDHMLVKFEPNRIVQNVPNFEFV